jgi:hypothetical protein
MLATAATPHTFHRANAQALMAALMTLDFDKA